jgi:hypothetical protein
MTTTSTPREPLTCNDVTERLIGGERAAADQALNEHVGSCLSCFRTSSDLRGLPTLRRQLQEVQGDLPDPGAAFWASLPAQTANLWQDQLDPATPAQVTAPLKRRWREWMASATAWIRMPVPAACTGALAAVAVVLLVMQLRGTPLRPTGEPGYVNAGVGLNAGAIAANDVRIGGRELATTGDEVLRELDVTSLRKLRAEMEQTLADGVRSRATGEGEEAMSTDPAALSEDLDELNEAGLAVLAENLEESI